MLCGREDNRRSGVALAMHAAQTLVVYPPTGSTANEREASTPPMPLLGYGPLCYSTTFSHAVNAIAAKYHGQEITCNIYLHLQ